MLIVDLKIGQVSGFFILKFYVILQIHSFDLLAYTIIPSEIMDIIINQIVLLNLIWLVNFFYYLGYLIDGYQPALKLLKDLKSKILGYDDIMHYMNIINALSLTANIMEQIDKVVKF